MAAEGKDMDTPLNRVEQLLQNSEMGLTIQRITQEASVTEKEAKASIKTLHAMGQIEMIPTPGVTFYGILFESA